jgi:hypothetical protein
MDLFSLASLILLADVPRWRDEGMVDGLKVELRAVDGSSFEEIRITTSSPLKLSTLCDAIWAKGLTGKRPEGDFKKRVVLKETDTERWTYEQIHVPVVTDRDYLMGVKLLQPATSGRCEVAFETRTDARYPPVADHVRIPNIRGSWLLLPTPDGQVSIRYTVYSEPGGGLPAILARGGQRDAALSFFKLILSRARAASSL